MSTQINTTNVSATMTSREIAELCEKEHKHIRRDIEKMLSDIGIDGSKFGHIYFDTYNREQKEYRLPKDLTVTLITGYRADLRYKVIKRLDELESKQPPVLDLNDPAQLRGLLGTYAERTEVAEAEVKRLTGQNEALSDDANALACIAKADGSLCMRDAAKALQLRPIDLNKFLSCNGWIYRQAQRGPWLGYQSKITTGVLLHKVTTVDRSDGTEKIVTQCRVTPKGLSKLAKLIPTAVREVA